ncbi:MAG: type II toxin-antitoxin system RelE/ParE family toxin [Rhizobiales bacterium]|nr:type II toxin-antitoxin system RelE/ParE family toxin [Hyphomicrobiales bacterium]
MKPVAFTPEAKLDLLAIADYIATDNPRRAVTFIEALEHFPAKWEPVRRRKCDQIKKQDRCKALAKAPRQFPQLGADAHILPYRNYLILYRDLPTEISIERILHGARDIMALIAPDA